MLDFLNIKTKTVKSRNVKEIFPSYNISNVKDIMIRGGKFYAVWDEKNKIWSKDEIRAIEMIDEELYNYKSGDDDEGMFVQKLYLSTTHTKEWENWKKYITRAMPDNFRILDEKVIFQNTPPMKSNYATRSLPYSIEAGDCPCYHEIMSTLYDPIERNKLEWSIGSIIAGDSKRIQKFIVLYGKPGSGKSTFLNIVEKLFDGYWSSVNLKRTTGRSEFQLEDFKTDPLIGIQHDGDLSHIEDNTALNSIVSHETMAVNEKYKSSYEKKFKTFLFIGTNKPVKITEAKSGLLRRLIDVYPSGRRIERNRYDYLMSAIENELGAIANHCYELYKTMGRGYYDSYVPDLMMSYTNIFYDFIMEYSTEFKKKDSMALSEAWALYKEYCQLSNIEHPMKKLDFKVELTNYFDDFKDRFNGEYNVYFGFKQNPEELIQTKQIEQSNWLDLENRHSILDDILKNCPAQYASKTTETPKKKWEDVDTKLSDIDTAKLHYIRPGENHIVIDFDLVDETGNKSLDINLKAAESWPATYAETSKSGNGLHLHYIYDGDVEELSNSYEPGIEIKVFSGLSALRRKVTKCNDIPVTHISSGLPLKERRKNVLSDKRVKSEKGLRKLIDQNLRKEIHPGTKPSIEFIKKILDDAYIDGMPYDVSDMRQAILAFANNSTNHPEYCLKQVMQMKFKSEDPGENIENGSDDPLCFFDIEVFPNLFVVVWKYDGVDQPVKMINPTPEMIRELSRRKLIGFNNRRYDNHILYARIMGYDNEQLFALSQKIINGSRNAMFNEAYNLSYTDVYDFASAANKMSLKKWEIKLGLHHLELGLPWDKPVPEELWGLVADYCVNDVIATEATFHHLSGDWKARQILAKLSGLTVNDSTNQHSTKIIFGADRNPKSEFVYTDLSEMFPGYTFSAGTSTYRDEVVGEGGYVYAEPGYYTNVALLDVASMHPTSIENLNLFGKRYTKRFSDLKTARVYIKHGDFEKCKNVLDGQLMEFLDDKSIAKDLSNALKTVINSVYGLTSATFDNKFRDPRNVDNIVAKRGALFMIDLKHAVQEKGFTVAHIKTDSIKIPNATQEIIDFVFKFGQKYGYEFEHEATYQKMCLVNDAVYVARDQDEKWSATGAQFQHPYVFKKLFSGEDVIFDDLCETKSVSTAIYLDANETLGEDEHEYIFVGRTGQFCPIKEGCGGGILLRQSGDKYNAVTGTKGYRWLESENVKLLEKEKDIDLGYFDELLTDAIETLEKYVSYDELIAEEISSEPMNPPTIANHSLVDLVKMYNRDGELPFDLTEEEIETVRKAAEEKIDLPWDE